MIPEDEKTPVLDISPEILLESPEILLEEPSNIPGLHRTRPAGRPVGTLSVSEMVSKITLEVSELAKVEREQALAELRASLKAEVRSATGLAIAAMAMNAFVVAAVLVLTHLVPSWVAGVTVVGLLLFFAGFAGAVGRERSARKRAPGHPRVTGRATGRATGIDGSEISREPSPEPAPLT
jgi:hypothetical protein